MKTYIVLALFFAAALVLRAEASPEEANRIWLEGFEGSGGRYAAAIGIIGGITMTADLMVDCPGRPRVDIEAVARDVAWLLREEDTRRFPLVENVLVAYAVRAGCKDAVWKWIENNRRAQKKTQ
jgi:hypothetical protein